jgi:hypothetical protein
MSFEDNNKQTIPDRRALNWMAPVSSCLMGTFLAAVIAGLLINRVSPATQLRMFFIYLLVLAPLFSYGWHWLFHLRPDRLAKKLQDESANPAGSGPVHRK